MCFYKHKRGQFEISSKVKENIVKNFVTSSFLFSTGNNLVK